MRVNTGLIFFGLCLLLIIFISVLFRKKATFMNAIATGGSLIVCTIIGLIFFGFQRMQVVPAALIREGLNQTRIPFATINICLLVITVAGFVLVCIADIMKKKKK